MYFRTEWYLLVDAPPVLHVSECYATELEDILFWLYNSDSMGDTGTIVKHANMHENSVLLWCS